MPPQYSPPSSPETPPSPVIQPSAGGRSRRTRIILTVLGIILALNALSGLGFWLYAKAHKEPRGPKTDDTATTALQKPSLSTGDLQGVNKEEAFYAYLKQAAQQQKAVITKAYYFSDDGSPKPFDTFVRTGVDYQTKRITYAYDAVDELGRDRIRCYDGQAYFYHGYLKEWSSGDDTDCRREKLYASVTDGFSAGGLTAAQAETFVRYLRGRPGLVTVQDMTLITHAGKQYVRFKASLTPIESEGYHFGAQWLMWSFKKTGLDPDVHPFGYVGAADEGFSLEYFIDPATSLPAYSELTAIASDDPDTSNHDGDYRYKIRYDFTKSTFDASQANMAEINLDW